MKKSYTRSGWVVRSILDHEFPRLGVLFSWLDVSRILRVHEQSVRRYFASGKIKRCPKIFGHNAVTKADLIAFITTKYKNDIDRAIYFVQEVEAQYRAHEARLSAVHGSPDDSTHDGVAGDKIN